MSTFALKAIYNNPTAEVLDYSLLNCSLDELKFSSKTLITTVNQYSYVIAEQDAEFKQALMNSDVLLPDGIGMVAAAKLLNNENVTKIAGADIHQHLLEKLEAEGGSCFYLGSSQKTLYAIQARMAAEYPNIRVGAFSPAFKAQFSDADNAEMIAAVNEFKPDVLFVGMTAPKQEKWSAKFKDQLDVKVICAIGAVFDFYAGTIKRPSQFWINLGLEWAVRLAKEPKRMAKRYVYYGPVFVYSILKMKLVSELNKGQKQAPVYNTAAFPVISLNNNNAQTA